MEWRIASDWPEWHWELEPAGFAFVRIATVYRTRRSSSGPSRRDWNTNGSTLIGWGPWHGTPVDWHRDIAWLARTDHPIPSHTPASAVRITRTEIDDGRYIWGVQPV